jgi:basic amino acid/polyamine antiporter, APA family
MHLEIQNKEVPAAAQLVRGLGLRDSLAIVIGSVIGTGIFLKTAVMAAGLGSGFWVMAAWGAAGVLSLLGAMTYSELGALFPQAGGGYVYLREAFGRMAAFLSGWISFWIIAPGSVAAFGSGAAIFLGRVVSLESLGGGQVVAPALILFFSALNSLAITFGGWVQSILTALKIALILGLSVSVFLFAPDPQGFAELTRVTASGWGAFGAATLAALWAFDGWEGVARVAGEIRNPQRNVPLALVLGMLAVFGLYELANLAYFHALPFAEIANANSQFNPGAAPVAAKAVMGFWGEGGARLISAVFVISTLGAMNGSIMTSARIPFAMARDGLFFRALGHLSPRTRVPVRVIWCQALLACLLTLTGTFDQLTDYVIFAAWIVYAATGASLFVFRKRRPDTARPYRVPGYPWVPAAFVILAATLVVATVVQSPRQSAIGLGLIMAGVPFYFFTRGKNKGAA